MNQVFKWIFSAVLLFGISLVPKDLMAKSTQTTMEKEAQEMHKVVFHLTSNVQEEHIAMLKHIENLSAGLKDKIIIEVVAHGPGISMFMKENPLAKQAVELQTNLPVRFSICENTLKQKNIDKSALYPGLYFVPGGLVHVIKLQEQGYAYIKANF